MDWGEPDETCIICLEDVDHEKELVCALKCSCGIDKKYHKNCIVEWIQRDGRCPYCRGPARIRYLQVISCYYYPESNYDPILDYDFNTLVEFNKNIKFEINFKPLSECIVKPVKSS